MREGVRLGIDVGTVRIGIARSDKDGLLATPYETLERTSDYLHRLSTILEEISVFEIVIGLPLSLSGEHTASTNDAIEVSRAIASVTEIPVRLIDERLTTVSAHSAMKAVGKNQKKSRPVIDQVAAVLILQQALDSERSTGQLAGKALSEFPEQA